MIKVSVVIPVYNEELYLAQCLNSVCTQTMQDIEIICIDDGSTDNSFSILERYAKQDSRIRLMEQNNQFAGSARNLGIQNAKGKYICFLDSDDFFAPQLLEKMYEAAEQYRSEIVICDAQYFNDMTGDILERNVPHEKQFLPPNRNRFSKNDIADSLFQITNGWAWDKLFLASFVRKERLQFSGSRTANDGFFVYMALALADKITKIDQVLVTQRINNSKSLVNTRVQSWKCGFDMLCDVRTGLLERELYGQLERTFLNWALKYIIWSYDSMASWEGKERIYNYVHEIEKLFFVLDHPSEYYYYPSEYVIYQQMVKKSFGSYVEEIIFQKESELKRLAERQKRLKETLKKKKWEFPFLKVSRQMAIVIYGAGQVGQDYYRQISNSGYCDIVLWMDKKFEGKYYQDEDVVHGWLKELEMIDYDKVVLALSREEDMKEATELLLRQGVEKQKIVWEI